MVVLLSVNPLFSMPLFYNLAKSFVLIIVILYALSGLKIRDNPYLNVNESDSDVTLQNYSHTEHSPSDDVVITKVNVKMGKVEDLSDFGREKIVGTRGDGASIPEMVTF